MASDQLRLRNFDRLYDIGDSTNLQRNGARVCFRHDRKSGSQARIDASRIVCVRNSLRHGQLKSARTGCSGQARMSSRTFRFTALSQCHLLPPIPHRTGRLSRRTMAMAPFASRKSACCTTSATNGSMTASRMKAGRDGAGPTSSPPTGREHRQRTCRTGFFALWI